LRLKILSWVFNTSSHYAAETNENRLIGIMKTKDDFGRI